MINYPIIFEIEFLHEFQERYGKAKGMRLCLVYQIWLDGGWKAVFDLLPKGTAERDRRQLAKHGYGL